MWPSSETVEEVLEEFKRLSVWEITVHRDLMSKVKGKREGSESKEKKLQKPMGVIYTG